MNKHLNPTLETPEKTLAETAYRRLREDIVSGVLEPGSKLKIDMLRTRYALGAGPLREALARLLGEHLVAQMGQRGFIVAPMSASDATEIGQLRLTLETDALRQSIPNGDAEWENALILAYHRLEQQELGINQGADQLDQWEDLNRQFHDALVAACPSIWLLRLRQTMFHHHERYRRLSRKKTVLTRDIHREHKALFDAALARDTDRSVAIIRAHIQRTTEVIAATTKG